MTYYNPMSKEFQDECKRLGITGNELIVRYRYDRKPTNVEYIIRKFKNENKDKKIYAIIRRTSNQSAWEFRLKRNGIFIFDNNTTHLMLVGLSSIENKLPDHVWLIPIDKCENKNSIIITDNTKQLLIFREFEITEKLFNKKIEYDEKGTTKYYQELAKKDGFDNIKEWFKWKDETVGKSLPENTNCTAHIGTAGENTSDQMLIELFGGLERNIPLYGNGYDRIVKGGFKVDIKVRSLRYKENHGWIGFSFEIDYNKKTDYFLLIGIDNLIDRNIMYIWLIHKDEIIRGKKFYSRVSFNITNKENYISKLQKYEVKNRLKTVPKTIL